MKKITFHPYQSEQFDFHKNLSTDYEILLHSHKKQSSHCYNIGHFSPNRNELVGYNYAESQFALVSDTLNVEPSPKVIQSSIIPNFEQHYFGLGHLRNHKVYPMLLKQQESLQKRCQLI